MKNNALPVIGARYRVTSEFSMQDARGKKPTIIGSVIAVNNAHRFAALKIEYPTAFTRKHLHSPNWPERGWDDV